MNLILVKILLKIEFINCLFNKKKHGIILVAHLTLFFNAHAKH